MKSSRQNRTDTHTNSERLWQHVQNLHRFKPDKILSLRRGGRYKILPTNKKVFEIITCWERENHFSSMDCHWAYQPHFSWKFPWPGVVGQNRLHYWWGFLFVSLSVLLFAWVFKFSFLMFWRGMEKRRDRETEREVVWVGRWEGSWRS